MAAIDLGPQMDLADGRDSRAPNAAVPFTLAGILRRAVKGVVSRPQGDLTLVEFEEGGRRIFAWCPDDETFTLSRELILARVYERTPIWLRECSGTVVDAGAHVGIFSLQAARWSERVVSLEANGRNHTVLKLNLARNGVVNVDARHCALWPTSDAILGFCQAPHSGGGEVVEVGPGSEAHDRIDAVSLDDLVDELGPIDLLKIDIEGGEHAVFAASRCLDQIGRIVGEIHLDSEDDPRLAALESILSAAGFVTRIVAERELYSARELPRLISNVSSLRGCWPAKLAAACYLMAPISKPVHAPGASYSLPLLVAWRQALPTSTTPR